MTRTLITAIFLSLFKRTAWAGLFDSYPRGKKGDVTWIPPELPHQFKNSSDQDTLRIFWTYASSSATRTMVETGETHSIDSEHSN